MAEVYVRQTLNRGKFVSDYLKFANVADKVKGRKVLVKPNLVSLEPYPTTTHPETLRAILLNLCEITDVVVADGPAFDSKADLSRHELASICRSFGIDLVDITDLQMKTVAAISGFKFVVSEYVLSFDYIISLPVLKSHCVCGITGALKNHYGFLSKDEKRAYHFDKPDKLHEVIAELSRLRKADVYIVDAVETLVNAQERRHGGKVKKLGFMAAGCDPVSLDSWGFNLLKTVDKRLRKTGEIAHLKHAIRLGVGEAEVRIQNF
jgi:uncharacterized protein (DUF362 family)